MIFLTQTLILNCDLAGLEKAFEGKTFDYVYNLAGETKYGQGDEVYEEKIFKLSVGVAKAAAKRNVKVFVEVSTGQVYDGDKVMMEYLVFKFSLYRNYQAKIQRSNRGHW